MNYIYCKDQIGVFRNKLAAAFREKTKTTLLLASIMLTLTALSTNAEAAPVVTPIAPPTIDEGSATPNPIASYTNVDTTLSHTATIDWGDGMGPQAYSVIEIIGSGTGDIDGFTIYGDDGAGSYASTICVKDSNSAETCEPLTITVNNVAPVISGTPLANPAAANEGSTTTLATFDFTDPSTVDDYTVTIDWGDPLDGADTIVAIASGTSPFTVPAQTHTYTDDESGPFTITITVDDNDLGSDSTTVSAAVNNANPVVTADINQSVGEGVSLVLNDVIYTDAGSGDTHSALINWGDGDSTPIALGTDASPLSGYNHTYVDNGFYDVEIIVTDDDLSGVGIDTVNVTVTNTAPVVDPAGATQLGNEGATFTLSDVTFSDDGALDTHTVSINWGDGVTTTPPDTLTPISGKIHTYVDNGSYNVQVSVKDNDGSTGSNIFVVDISNVIPLVSDPVSFPVFTEGTTTSSVIVALFTDAGTSDGTDLGFTSTINWGDSSSDPGSINELSGSGDVSGTHSYATQGTKTISVTVTDKDGGISAVNEYDIVVGNAAPELTVPGGQVIDEGSPLTISTISFVDFGGDAGSGDPHTATLDWGDGTGSEAGTVDNTANTITGIHTFVDEGTGTYLLEVQVFDDEGLSAVSPQTITVTVNNAAPVVTVPADITGIDIGNPVSPAGASFTDLGVNDTHSATIDWGDGSGTEVATVTQGAGSGTLALPIHTYTIVGTHTATIAVTDNDGGIGNDTFTIEILNVAPTVTAGVDQIINEGSVLTLNDVTFTDPGTLDTFTATIVWGDGSADTTIDPATSPISGETHTYEDSTGSDYEIIVTVTDNGGLSGSDAVTVTVNNVAPVVTALINTATITEGDMVSLSPSTFTDVGTLDTHSATIDWGDGSGIDVGTVTYSGPGAGDIAGMHTFVDEGTGTYNINVTVTDDDGGVDNDVFVLTVLNTAPVATSKSFPITEDTATFDEYMIATDAGSTDTLSYTILTSTSNGTVSIGSAGGFTTPFKFTYTPNTNFSGTDILVYQIEDNDLAVSAPATVTFIVSSTNDNPAPVDGQIDTYIGAVGTTTIDPNDPDPLDTHTYTIATAPTEGTVDIVDATGVASYTPNFDNPGYDFFTVIVEDQSGGKNAIPITIEVFVDQADDQAPVDGTSFAVAGGNSSATLTWDEIEDFNAITGAEFADKLSGIEKYTIVRDTASSPAKCPGGGITVLSVIDSVTTTYTYNYVDSPLVNGTTYYYRICATDRAGKTSNGVERTVTPDPLALSPDGIYIPGSDINGNGYNRVDGGSDLSNLDAATAKPIVDIEYYYSIVVKDTGGTPSVNIYMSSRTLNTSGGALTEPDDFTSYPMTCATNYATGALCTFTTTLGPADNHIFYYDVTLSDSSTVRYPAGSTYLDGPAVRLLNFYAMVGLPRDMTSGATLNGVQAFGDNRALRWNSTGLSQGALNSGSYLTINFGNDVAAGEGYFVYTNLTTTLNFVDFDTYADNLGATHNITLVPGWNIISNPYGGNVNLSDVTVGALTWAEAVTAGEVLNGIYYYNGEDWGSTYTLQTAGGTPEAKLVPWLGYWVYLKNATDTTITITKP